MVTNGSDSNPQNNSAQHTTSGNVNSVLFGQAPPDWMEYFPALQYEQADEPAALHLSPSFGPAFGRKSLHFGSQH
jgi:hypothetical protein